MDCRPDAQKRLMVMAAASIGMPARSEAVRATFIPCSASGMAQPMMTSSISFLSRLGTRARAPWISNGAEVVGAGGAEGAFRGFAAGGADCANDDCFSHQVPLLCGMVYLAWLVAKGLAGFQRECNPLLSFLLAAEGEECLALQV